MQQLGVQIARFLRKYVLAQLLYEITRVFRSILNAFTILQSSKLDVNLLRQYADFLANSLVSYYIVK
jgi:hypothetical protein